MQNTRPIERAWVRGCLSDKSVEFGTPELCKSFSDSKCGQAMYAAHFPVTQDPALCRAMQIAMEYVRAVGLAEKFNNPEALVATGISTAWESGVRHPIALANAGIVCAERTANLGRLPSMYVRLV
jgi:hypothetical protein